MEYFAESDDKAEAFVFCRERMEADMTTEAPRLKEMSRELSKKLRRFGGTGTKRAALAQEAKNHIYLDRTRTGLCGHYRRNGQDFGKKSGPGTVAYYSLVNARSTSSFTKS